MEIEEKTFIKMVSDKAVLSTLIRVLANAKNEAIKSGIDAQGIYYEIRPYIDKLIKEEERIRDEH